MRERYEAQLARAREQLASVSDELLSASESREALALQVAAARQGAAGKDADVSALKARLAALKSEHAAEMAKRDDALKQVAALESYNAAIPVGPR